MWEYGSHWSTLPKQLWKSGKERNKIAIIEECVGGGRGGEDVAIVTIVFCCW